MGRSRTQLLKKKKKKNRKQKKRIAPHVTLTVSLSLSISISLSLSLSLSLYECLLLRCFFFSYVYVSSMRVCVASSRCMYCHTLSPLDAMMSYLVTPQNASAKSSCKNLLLRINLPIMCAFLQTRRALCGKRCHFISYSPPTFFQ